MAFLCPVRIRRGKQKKSPGVPIDLNESKDTSVVGSFIQHRPSSTVSNNTSGVLGNISMGRITGSASIETLVRVGLEKEHGLSPDSKMVVLHDFTPCVDDELEVKRGQSVNILYRENDWVYVIGQDSRQEGFIPHSYCAPSNTQLADLAIKKKLPRNTSSIDLTTPVVHGLRNIADSMTIEEIAQDDSIIIIPTGVGGLFEAPRSNKTSSQNSISSEPEFLPFEKDPSGRYIVLYTFIARDENDVSVERGEFVTVLNREDPEWFWIVRSDGQEGFIPSGFVYAADNILHQKVNKLTTQKTAGIANNSIAIASSNILHNLVNNGDSDDLRYHGTELVMLYDYKAQAPDDLSIRRGDWIYADLNNQTVDGWLWAYAPKTRKYGFIPKAYARPPAMTSL